MTGDMRAQFYENYADWKSWASAENPPYDASEFDIEIRRAGIPRGGAILEVGFGEGALLDWARDAEYRVVGVDISPELVAAAQQRGHVAYLGDARDVLKDLHDEFDAIVCLDILEHLTVREIAELFGAFAAVLKPDGKIIARFPNGGSPFGRLYQHGDATHMTTLTGSLIDQIAMLAGMRVLGEYNAARPARGARGKGIKNSVVLRKLAFLARDAINAVLGIAYFGRVVPFDPKMTVVIGKAS